MRLPALIKEISALLIFLSITTNSLSDESTKFRLASELEKHFLRQLGLQERPKIGNKFIEIREDVIQEYFAKTGIKIERTAKVPSNEERVEGFSSNTLRTFPGKLFSLSNTVDSKFWIFSFEFLRQQFVGDNIELKEATVRLKWKPTLNKGQLASQNGQFKVKIFDLIKTGDGFNDCANVDDFHMMQMDIKKVLKSSKDPLSIELDATPAVRRWIKKTKTEHFRILIEKGDLRVKKSARASTTGNGESLAADLEVNEDSLGGMLNFTPKGTFDDVYLKVFSQDHEPKTRMKRAPLKKKIQPPFKGLEGICQLHSYYYDFSLGGWDDWIISPKGFHANLCFGFCPRHMPDHMNSTNNAIIQRLMHDTNPEVFDPPCCVPTEYEPLSLLIIEDEETEKVNVKTFEKMVVTSCGCR